MNKNKNVIKIAAMIGGVLLLSVGAFFAYKKFGPKKQEEEGTDNNSGNETSEANKSISTSNDTSSAAQTALNSIISGTGAPRSSTPRTKIVSNYTDGQRVYAKIDSGLYDKPVLRSTNITHRVKKDQPIGVFRQLSVSGEFAYLSVVLKDSTGKYAATYKYIPLANIRPANISKGEKN